MAIKQARDQGRPVALILPVGPMGMYRWAVFFLKEWDVSCDHVFGFNMDEWSDRSGATCLPDHPGAFQNAMQAAFYGPLGRTTVRNHSAGLPRPIDCRIMPNASAS